MQQTINTNTLREQLLDEVNHSNPEILELVYNFMQVLKKSSQKDKEEHPLLKHFGVIDEQSGQEMIDLINQEFNTIQTKKQDKKRLKIAVQKLQDINPFKEITNPSKWQKELRDEWERSIIR